MMKYIKQIRSGSDFEGADEYFYESIEIDFKDFSVDNFRRNGDVFEKILPSRGGRRMGRGQRGPSFMLITKETTSYDNKINELFNQLVLIQFILLGFFALLSLFLARNAIAPLRKNIEKLDHFAKDLIHDLNTPVTAIGLNLKLLNKEPGLKDHRALQRLQKSANDISDLHTNLNFLLKEKSYEMETINLKLMIDTLVISYTQLYPALNFEVESFDDDVQANSLALKQVLDNLLSNACKYSKEKGTILFSYKNRELKIVDDGIGIKHPERVFERNYTEHSHSSGIGLDIVKRLCEIMQISIKVESLRQGTVVRLEFK